MRTLVALNGSPVRQSSVDRMLAAVCAGAEQAGGRALHIRCDELSFKSCQACGPEPTTGFCIFHDDMDRVYEALRDAHAVVVGSPVYFDGVSGQLKLVMDRQLHHDALKDGTFRPQWVRAARRVRRRGSASHPHELAERGVRGSQVIGRVGGNDRVSPHRRRPRQCREPSGVVGTRAFARPPADREPAARVVGARLRGRSPISVAAPDFAAGPVVDYSCGPATAIVPGFAPRPRTP
jgi:hypothetical protein